jgi:hypothetical protein
MSKPDTGTREIEVTPEMIRAGAEIIADNAREIARCWASPTSVAEDVFRAMLALSPQCGRAHAE